MPTTKLCVGLVLLLSWQTVLTAAESKPAENKPAESKPAESKPAEPKPAEPKPAETKPAPPKPAEKKAPAKKAPKPPPVMFTDEAAAGADFKIQGEYEGELTDADGSKSKYGAQIIGRHEGKFEGCLLAGGLPGAGWDEKARIKLTLATGSDGRTLGSDERKPSWSWEVADGRLRGRLEADGKTATAELARVVRTSPTAGAKPPAGAVVLFDGSSTDEWVNAKLQETPDGKFLLAGTQTKRNFADCTVHLEWRLVYMPRDRGNRSNSGIFLDNFYEVQILDSFGLPPEKHGCGAMYTYYPPRLNMCFPPLQWQTYDIDFTAPRFGPDGKKISNAKITVRHNGVVIHDNAEYPKGTNLRPDAKPTGGAILLQNHGSPVLYRNVWVLEKQPQETKPDPTKPDEKKPAEK